VRKIEEKYLDKPIVQFGDAKRLRWLFLRISLCIRQIPKVISNDQYPTNSSLTFKLQSGRDASEEVNRSTVMKDTDRVRVRVRTDTANLGALATLFCGGGGLGGLAEETQKPGKIGHGE
jgi:hypothetical protein